MIVFGSGGHTTEMLLMLKSINFNLYNRVFFVLGHSDTWSLTKIKDFYQKERQLDIEKQVPNLTIVRLFRSREVKQSYLTSVLTTLMGLAHSVLLVVKSRPDIVNLTNSEDSYNNY
jgi:beta-1,4-N-acetylglucosaminyltransferase